MTSPSTLMKVAQENWQSMGAGIDPDVAAEIGYNLPADMPGILERAESEASTVQGVASAAGAVICGDCMQVVPCAHVGVRSDGSRYTKGY